MSDIDFDLTMDGSTYKGSGKIVSWLFRTVEQSNWRILLGCSILFILGFIAGRFL